MNENKNRLIKMANVHLIIGAVAVVVGIGFLLYDYINDGSQQHQNQNNYSSGGSFRSPPNNDWNDTEDISNQERRRRRRRQSQSNDCSICFEGLDISKTQKISCGHVFHVHCITPWLIEKSTCPLCRKFVR